MWRYKVIVWIAGISLLLASCTDGSRYVQALPKDAALVSSIQLESLVGKAGLKGDGNGLAWAGQLKRAVGDLGNLNTLVDNIVKEPSESGLALDDRLYFFVGAHSASAGVLARVADEGKIDDLLGLLGEQQICEPLRAGEGCKWTTAGRFLIAYSDVAFLMMLHPQGGSPADLQHQAARLLRQDESEGFSASSDYDKMHSAQGDIVTFASLNVLPQTYLTSLMMGVSAELNPQNINLLVALDFLKGRAVMDVQAFPVGEAMSRQIQKYQEIGEYIKGTFLDCFPANTGLWISSNVNGEKLYEFIE